MSKIKETIKEGIGFFIEVSLFYLAGVFSWINLYISILLFVLGLLMATAVGKMLIKRGSQ